MLNTVRTFNCMRAAMTCFIEVWNRWYAPVFGVKDSDILAVYSHMIVYGLYLPDYAIGLLLVAALAMPRLITPAIALAGFASLSWVTMFALFALSAAVGRSGTIPQHTRNCLWNRAGRAGARRSQPAGV